MKQYNEYKDSEINSVEKIPFDWKEKRLKDVTSLIVDGAHFTPTYVDAGIPFLRVTDVQTKEINFDKIKFIPKEEHLELCRRAKAEKGDLLLSKNGTIGLMKIVDWEWEFSFFVSLCLIRFHKEISPYYFKYFFQSHAVDQQLKASSKTTSVTNLHLDKINLLKIAFPDRNEQSIIIDFLDNKIGKIDRLIANKNAQIQQFKEIRQIEINTTVTKGLHPNVPMRNSGIEWLGEIPEHWKIRRLKNFSKIKYGLGQPPRLKPDGLPIIRATNVYRGKIDTNNLLFVDPDDVPYERDPVLREDDIIVVRSGAYTADSAIIPKEYDGAITGYDMVFTCLKTVSAKFISFTLLSNYVLKSQLLVKSLRAAQPHLNKEELGETLIAIPPFEEQLEIVSLLIKKISGFDTVIENLQTQINHLQEIRKIEIYNAVTGKIKIS